MSQSAADASYKADPEWFRARNELFAMIKQGRSFSGRERNCCFFNLGRPTATAPLRPLATVSAISGLNFADDGRAVSVSDWDHDGDLDLWIANRNAPRLRLLRNDLQTSNHHLTLLLEGNGQSTNRDAIGARIVVTVNNAETGSRQFHASIRAGEGFLSQSSKRVHFGIGQATSIRSLTVNWPGGQTESFRVQDLQLDRSYRLVQGSGQPVPVDKEQLSRRPLPAHPQPTLPSTQVARLPLITQVPMPSVPYNRWTNPAAADGSSQVFQPGSRPALLSLWATWCQPCLTELAEFTANRDQLDRVGVEVIALSVDQLGDRQTPLTSVAAMASELGYGQRWGWIDESTMDVLQTLNDQFFFPEKPLPLPSSFLVDQQGRLTAIYRGPVSAERIVQDLNRPRHTYADSMQAAALFPGSVLDVDHVRETANRADAQTRYRVAAWTERIGDYDSALRGFQELARRNPDNALAHRHLAKLYLNRGQLTRAEKAAARTLELDANNAGAHNTLGLVRSRQGAPQQAEQRLQRAIELNPEFAEAYNNLGVILAEQGKMAAARKRFEKAVELDDQFAEAITNLGSCYLAQNRYADAARMYQKAIQADPNYVDAYNNLGTLLARAGRLDDAVHYYREALQRDPDNAEVKANLRRALVALGNVGD